MRSGSESAHVLEAWKASMDERAAEEKKRQDHIMKILKVPDVRSACSRCRLSQWPISTASELKFSCKMGIVFAA